MGSKLRGEERLRIHDSIVLKAEEGSIIFKFFALPAIWMTINASGLIFDLQAISRGDVFAVQDSSRMKILMALESSLRRVGAKKVGISSVAGSLPEFDLLSRDISAKVAQAPVFDSEAYVVSEIENLGGAKKVNANLRVLSTGEKIVAESDRGFISQLQENLLYKVVIAHVGYKYNAVTKEKYEYKLLDFRMPPSKFDIAEFDRSLETYHTGWNDIDDPISEIRKLRGENV